MFIQSNYASIQNNLSSNAVKQGSSHYPLEISFQKIQKEQFMKSAKNQQISNQLDPEDKMLISKVMQQNNTKPIITKGDSKDIIPKDSKYNLENFDIDFLCNFVINRCVDPKTTIEEEIKLCNAVTDEILGNIMGRPVVDDELSPDEIDLRVKIHTGISQMIGAAESALKTVAQRYSSQWREYMSTGKSAINFHELLKKELLENETYHFKNVLGLSFLDMFKQMDAMK